MPLRKATKTKEGLKREGGEREILRQLKLQPQSLVLHSLPESGLQVPGALDSFYQALLVHITRKLRHAAPGSKWATLHEKVK